MEGASRENLKSDCIVGAFSERLMEMYIRTYRLMQRAVYGICIQSIIDVRLYDLKPNTLMMYDTLRQFQRCSSFGPSWILVHQRKGYVVDRKHIPKDETAALSIDLSFTLRESN